MEFCINFKDLENIIPIDGIEALLLFKQKKSEEMFLPLVLIKGDPDKLVIATCISDLWKYSKAKYIETLYFKSKVKDLKKVSDPLFFEKIRTLTILF